MVDVAKSAGSIGGSAGGAFGGGAFGSFGGGRGGAKGAEKAARRMKAAMAVRIAAFDGPPGAIVERCRNALPQLEQLAAPDDRMRFLVPVGRTGLQRVVVDVIASGRPAGGDELGVVIRTDAKEGKISRKPAQRVADRVAGILATPEYTVARRRSEHDAGISRGLREIGTSALGNPLLDVRQLNFSVALVLHFDLWTPLVFVNSVKKRQN